MLNEATLFGEIDRVGIAIARIKEFCPPEGYWLAFSGGKDSIVIKRLAEMADVVYDAHMNLTSVDPPEVPRFIRTEHPDVEMHKPEKTMWKLIVDHGMPPTRRVRYCCEYLKERGGRGRVILTGIRWEESAMRRKRKMVETCFKHSDKRYVHPIIDWTEADVWEFIEREELEYCSLYDEGFKRIGCVLCPMFRGRRAHVERFPNFYKAYLRAFGKMLEERQRRGLETIKWDSPQAVMDWWLSESKVKYDSRQILFSMFE